MKFGLMILSNNIVNLQAGDLVRSRYSNGRIWNKSQQETLLQFSKPSGEFELMMILEKYLRIVTIFMYVLLEASAGIYCVASCWPCKFNDYKLECYYNGRKYFASPC